MIGIMRGHGRGHVADDGLDDRKRDSGETGVVAERVTAGVEVLHADRPCASFRFACGLNAETFKELFDPVGNCPVPLGLDCFS